MPGRIDWDATFVPAEDNVFAEIYDGNGIVVLSDRIPCKPPVRCQFPMNNVEFAKYKAALAFGGDRYYYVAGQAVITVPNDDSSASLIDVNEENPIVSLSIYVDAS